MDQRFCMEFGKEELSVLIAALDFYLSDRDDDLAEMLLVTFQAELQE